MTSSIFLIQQGAPVELAARPYDSEKVLQELLAKYPSVLAGGEFDPDEPRRWVLVSRELGVPFEPDGSNRWALDHLFLDQDGIPTLVEVKQPGKSEIRRKVVGQMLDYAANAVAYWPIEHIRTALEKTCALAGAERTLTDLLGDGADIEKFWSTVAENLRNGNVRLVFVADELPVELKRIIEFLNEQMFPAEVLGVELRQ